MSSWCCYTSTPGFPGDIQLVQKIKEINPEIKISFVGPHVTVLPENHFSDCPAIDFIVRKEFDYPSRIRRRATPLDGDARR